MTAAPALSRNRAPVRITDVRETVVPIKSAISNAYIDFSQMTVSVAAVVTDAVREGRLYKVMRPLKGVTLSRRERSRRRQPSG